MSVIGVFRETEKGRVGWSRGERARDTLLGDVDGENS